MRLLDKDISSCVASFSFCCRQERCFVLRGRAFLLVHKESSFHDQCGKYCWPVEGAHGRRPSNTLCGCDKPL